MSTIDERVVSLKFNNGQFQTAVAATMDGLSKLKTSLNMGGAVSGLSDLGKATQSVSMTGLSDGVDKAAARFENLKVVGLAALATLVAKATSAGIEMGKSFVNNAFIKAPKEGLAEYELKMGSIQTILANTSKHGTKLKDVTKSLDELNDYSDKTIYNFGDMTRNIGLFTNAGIGLKDATSMIKGFSNEAAASGTKSADASHAAYQLSQALSAGKITLMDWRSLTNVGMGNANMQSGIIDIASAMGTFKGKATTAQKAGKDFNTSLSKGWLTADVMQNYLKIQAGELSDAQMKNIGLNSKQIEAFKKQQKVAEDAATKVRTLTQVIGNYGEVVGSGWAESWEIVFGDFDEATELFTNVSEAINKVAETSAKTRNSMLQGWSDMGGRAALIEGVTNIFTALSKVMAPIKKAWAEVFPPSGVNGLYIITKAFENFTKLLIIGDGQATALGATFKFFFNILKVGIQIIAGVFIVLGKVLSAIFTGGESVNAFSDIIAKFFTGLNNALENTEWIKTFFTMLGDLIAKPISMLQKFGGALVIAFANSGLVQNFGQAINNVGKFLANFAKGAAAALGWFLYGGLEAAMTRVRERLSSIANFGDKIMEVFRSMGTAVKNFMKPLEPLLGAIGNMFKTIGTNIARVFTDVDFSTGLDMVNTGLLAGLFLLVKGFFKNVTGLGDGVKDDLLGKLDGIVGGVKEALSGLTGTLEAMQTNLKADTLIKIATAIAILTASVVVLSLIDSGKLTQALLAMTVMFTQLGVSMKVFEAVSLTTNMTSMMALGVALTLFATAIFILSTAVAVLSQLNWNELAKGLLGVSVLLYGMAKAAEHMGPHAANLISTGAGMILIAIAIKILASAVKQFSKLSFGDMIKGLVGVGTTLAALSIFISKTKISKGAIGSAAGMILLGVALKIIASAISDFAAINVGSLVQGFITLTAVLTALSLFSKSTGKVANMLSMGAGLILLSVALKLMAGALAALGGIPLWDLIKGLAAMAISLGTIAVAMNLMPANMIVSSIGLMAVSLSLQMLAGVLERFGAMSVGSIVKSLITLAISLGVIAVAMIAMTSALPGAAALLVVSAALAIFTPVLMALGGMEWAAIWTGLGALALAFTLLGVAALVLTPVIPSMLLLGVAILAIGIGTQAVGLGMAAFAAGLMILATTGAASIPILVGLIKQVIALLPYAAEQLGLALEAFAIAFVESIPSIVEALKQLLITLGEALITLMPTLQAVVVAALQMILDTLASGIPALITAGLQIILGILQGINDNIYQIVSTAYQIMIKFLNGIAENIGELIDAGSAVIIAFLEGIQRNQADVMQAGWDTVISFIDNMAASVENNMSRLGEAGRRLAFALADGVTGGLLTKLGEIKETVGRVAGDILSKMAGVFDINSPSKKTRSFGESLGEGLDVGMNNMKSTVTSTAGNMGENALSAIKSSMANVADAVDVGIGNPTIKPVLDLTSVKKDVSGIGSLFGNQVINPEISARKASTVASDMKAYEEERIKMDKDDQPRGIQLTQINNSPKALGTSEIYRHTNNQISRAKELVDAK